MTAGQAVEPCGPSDGVHADHATDEIGWHPDYRGQIANDETAAIELVAVAGELL